MNVNMTSTMPTAAERSEASEAPPHVHRHEYEQLKKYQTFSVRVFAVFVKGLCDAFSLGPHFLFYISCAFDPSEFRLLKHPVEAHKRHFQLVPLLEGLRFLSCEPLRDCNHDVQWVLAATDKGCTINVPGVVWIVLIGSDFKS